MSDAYDGTKPFRALHSEALHPDTPLDSWSVASLREQAYHLWRIPDVMAMRAPRSSQTGRWASCDWRAIWGGRMRLRQGMTELRAEILGLAGYDGQDEDVAPMVAIEIVGYGRAEAVLTVGERTHSVVWTLPNPTRTPIEALVLVELASAKGDVLGFGDFVPILDGGSPYKGHHKKQRLELDAHPGYDGRGGPEAIFASYDEKTGLDREAIEVLGIDEAINNPANSEFLTLEHGSEDVILATAELGYLELEALTLVSEHVPVGNSGDLIEIDLGTMRPQKTVRAREDVAHLVNAKGAWERPQLTYGWHEGSVQGERGANGEDVIETRWPAAVIADDEGVAAEARPWGDVILAAPREGAMLEVRTSALLVCSRASSRSPALRDQGVEATLTARMMQIQPGSAVPVAAPEVAVTQLLDRFVARVDRGRPLLWQLQLGITDQGEWAPGCSWREHIVHRDDLALFRFVTIEGVSTQGLDPSLPMWLDVRVELAQGAGNLPPGTSLWAVGGPLLIYERGGVF